MIKHSILSIQSLWQRFLTPITVFILTINFIFQVIILLERLKELNRTRETMRKKQVLFILEMDRISGLQPDIYQAFVLKRNSVSGLPNVDARHPVSGRIYGIQPDIQTDICYPAKYPVSGRILKHISGIRPYIKFRNSGSPISGGCFYYYVS